MKEEETFGRVWKDAGVAKNALVAGEELHGKDRGCKKTSKFKMDYRCTIGIAEMRKMHNKQ